MLVTDKENASALLYLSKQHAGQTLEDIDDREIIAGYKKYGIVMIRGFNYEDESFSRLTQRFCGKSVMNPSSDREVIDKERNIQTVNLGEKPFPLHPELAREPWRPDVCFFTCESAPRKGGETILCDGVKVVEGLNPVDIEVLQSQPLYYDSLLSRAEAEEWLGTSHPTMRLLTNPPAPCPYLFGVDDNKNAYKRYVVPALRRTMFGDELAFNNFALFSRYYHGDYAFPKFADGTPLSDELLERISEVCSSLTFAVRWEVGDILILDNSRFMHGRNPILDKAERRIISFFGYLNFAQYSDAEAQMPWRKG